MRRSSFTRREWLAQNAVATTAVAIPVTTASASRRRRQGSDAVRRTHEQHARPLEQGVAQGLAQRAVDVAKSAGATYADARLTRTVQHRYQCDSDPFVSHFDEVGFGVRALVDGYWGFAASPVWDADEAARLATEAVATARVNAIGGGRTVELGRIPQARGEWRTPVKRDPFAVSIEEKSDYLLYLRVRADQLNVPIDTLLSTIHFARQERVIATSDDALFTQTIYESGGRIASTRYVDNAVQQVDARELDQAGKGWELLTDANIPEQLRHFSDMLDEKRSLAKATKPGTIGRQTLVCDGATMAAMLESTLGVATQLDRAMGYEANASGTSYLDDPLAMLGTFQAAAPLITVTANRSAPGQLATVKWDDEGVEPHPFTLVKNGVLTDFQTTREQAAWLAPYYEKAGLTAQSHGCAASQSALHLPLQHMPNLALEPGNASASLDALVATVKEGVLVTKADAQTDFQSKNGLIAGEMRKITNGRLGPLISGVAVLFNTADFWKKISALGSVDTTGVKTSSVYEFGGLLGSYGGRKKGQPSQATSHSVTAVASVIPEQAIVSPFAKI